MKHYAMPGDELTEEQRSQAREFGEANEAAKKQLLESVRKPQEVDFMNVTFEPFEDRLLVYPDPVEEKTAGGIYKPEATIAKSKPLIGTIVKIGPGKLATPFTPEMGIPEVGTRIYYGNYAGTEITLGEVKYLIMRFADCFGKV